MGKQHDDPTNLRSSDQNPMRAIGGPNQYESAWIAGSVH
jgi:hypothetical protein